MSYQVSRVFKSSSSSSSSSSFLLRLRVPLIHYRRTPVYQTTFPRTQSCRRLHCFPSYRTYHNRSRPFLSPKSPENAGTEAGTGTGNAGNDNYLATLSSLDIPTGAKVMTVGQGVKYTIKVNHIPGLQDREPQRDLDIGRSEHSVDGAARNTINTSASLKQTIQEELPYAVIIDFSSTATSLGHEEAEAEILSQTQLQEQEQKQRVEIISQAIDTQIPLIVDLAKGPLKEDEVRMIDNALTNQSTSRLIGPNTFCVALPHLGFLVGDDKILGKITKGRIGIIATDKDVLKEIISLTSNSASNSTSARDTTGKPQENNGGWGQSAIFGIADAKEAEFQGTTTWEMLNWLLADETSEIICILGSKNLQQDTSLREAYESYSKTLAANQRAKRVYRLLTPTRTTAPTQPMTSTAPSTSPDPLSPSTPCDSLALPLSRPPLPATFFSPAPATLSLEHLRKLHKMSALIPPIPGSREEEELLKDVEGLIGLMDQVGVLGGREGSELDLESESESESAKKEKIRRLLVQASGGAPSSGTDRSNVIDGTRMEEVVSQNGGTVGSGRVGGEQTAASAGGIKSVSTVSSLLDLITQEFSEIENGLRG